MAPTTSTNKHHHKSHNRVSTKEKKHPHLNHVKEKINDAIHVTAQKLNLEPRERNPEAAHQDGKTNPE